MTSSDEDEIDRIKKIISMGIVEERQNNKCMVWGFLEIMKGDSSAPTVQLRDGSLHHRVTEPEQLGSSSTMVPFTIE